MQHSVANMISVSRAGDYQREADFVVSLKRTALSVLGLHSQRRKYKMALHRAEPFISSGFNAYQLSDVTRLGA